MPLKVIFSLQLKNYNAIVGSVPFLTIVITFKAVCALDFDCLVALLADMFGAIFFVMVAICLREVTSFCFFNGYHLFAVHA
ncbi:MAG TPA: hypothetical protein VLX29_08160 [Nitrospirota bacterium]|nr:hypothetical protein [Nitrospirota bacterium]